MKRGAFEARHRVGIQVAEVVDNMRGRELAQLDHMEPDTVLEEEVGH